MRPIWATDAPVREGGNVFEELANLELVGASYLEAILAAPFLTEVSSVLPIAEAAEIDLRAGCELARGGYFKQAYSLWRSWFEQTIFSLYFLEASLHRLAWRIVEEVKHGEEPPTKLMLHQLLAESGEKHPFAVVYAERFQSLFAALRITTSKSAGPIKTARHCLTDLSQGVHGTYVPKRVGSRAELPDALSRHALPTLSRARTMVGLFCLAFAHAEVGYSESQLVAAGSPDFSPSEPEEELLTKLIHSHQLWTGLVRSKT